jgi:hypothetical protein
LYRKKSFRFHYGSGWFFHFGPVVDFSLVFFSEITCYMSQMSCSYIFRTNVFQVMQIYLCGRMSAVKMYLWVNFFRFVFQTNVFWVNVFRKHALQSNVGFVIPYHFLGTRITVLKNFRINVIPAVEKSTFLIKKWFNRIYFRAKMLRL